MKYNNYEEYIDHQKQKTTDPRRRKKWLGEEWEMKMEGFKEIFNQYPKIIEAADSAICLGARTGQEVVALREVGVDNPIGIDIVPCEEKGVIKGDIHDIQFEGDSFDLVYTNIFDHALYPDKFCQEMERVVKSGGHIIMNLQIDTHQDTYTVTEIESIEEDVLSHFSSEIEILVNKTIPQNVHAMNWELLLKKKDNEDN